MSIPFIGIISDTHSLLRPEALDALQGSELIIHAGDVGCAEILDVLSDIAPVHAVRGNVDKGELAAQLPHDIVVPWRDYQLYALHIENELDLDPVAAGFHAIIFGHSHRPFNEHKQRVLYLNPGSAGPRRFSLPVTIARVRIEAGQLVAEHVELL